AARGARLLERRDHAAHHLVIGGVVRAHTVERRRAYRRVGVVEERDKHALACRDDLPSAGRRRRGAPGGHRLRAREAGRARGGGPGGRGGRTEGEPQEWTDREIRILMVGSQRERARGG